MKSRTSRRSHWRILRQFGRRVTFYRPPISYRQLEEMMAEHGVEVDHATLNRWVVKYVPLLEREFRTRKLPVAPAGEWTRPM